MKIGVIGAMESEIQLLREYLGNPPAINIHKYAFYQGKIGSHQVVVLLSGIGKVSAAVGTALLILRQILLLIQEQQEACGRVRCLIWYWLLKYSIMMWM